MIEIAQPGTGIIFMKVGTHAGETLENIVERKMQELTDANEIYWGYGGPTCHPILHVQPFVKERLESGHAIYLAMEQMNSKHFAEPKEATEYSDDGVEWHKIPDGIHVLGSRYALILNSLEVQETTIDLGDLRVGAGTSAGKSASKYIRGHVDKGCFVVEPARNDPEGSAKQVGLVATLKAPYAVLLK